ncbi:hypothetical protein [Methanocella arvoryzae]|uniref:hypothetical protein n=1 Tax=Methanocella arvoryzae TaxID=1175445 RepID=UPI000326293F|nr:hypothetical protein [Methanocella arvoryzae]
MTVHCPRCAGEPHEYAVAWRRTGKKKWLSLQKYRCLKCGHRFEKKHSGKPPKSLARAIAEKLQYGKYTGIFQEFGIVRDNFCWEKTFLFVDIKDIYGNLVRDHQWFRYDSRLEMLRLQTGDRIAFTAKIGTYKKGYRGKDPVGRALHPVIRATGLVLSEIERA